MAFENLLFRSLQRYNDNTRYRTFSRNEKTKQTFINSRNFYKVRKTRFVATYAIASYQKVLVGLDSLYFKIKSFNNYKTTIPQKKNMIWLNFTHDEEVFPERVTK